MKAIHQDMPDDSTRISGSECAQLCPNKIQESYARQTILVDSVQVDQVTDIDTVIRVCQESCQSPPKFVLAAHDVKTEERLKTSLMGGIAEVELPPIQIQEHLEAGKKFPTTRASTLEDRPQPIPSSSPNWNKEVLWLRGGLPDSLNAKNDTDSLDWKKKYLDCMLKQDLGSWGIDASDRFAEVFRWIVNNNGAQFDEANCAKRLSIKKDSVRRSLDLLKRMGLLRHLPNWPAGTNKSNSSMPVYYIRDSGLLHAMLGIETVLSLYDNKALGHSWEGFCIETIINASPRDVTPAFYRDKEKNEIDLVLCFSNGNTYAIEFKVSETACVTKSFPVGCIAIGATHKIVVHAGESDKTSTTNSVSWLSLTSALRSLPQ